MSCIDCKEMELLNEYLRALKFQGTRNAGIDARYEDGVLKGVESFKSDLAPLVNQQREHWGIVLNEL